MVKMYEVYHAKRLALGMTQAQLAEKVGTTAATISSFENGAEVSTPVFNMIKIVIKREANSLPDIEREIFNMRWRMNLLDGGDDKNEMLNQLGGIMKSCGFMIQKLTENCER